MALSVSMVLELGRAPSFKGGVVVSNLLMAKPCLNVPIKKLSNGYSVPYGSILAVKQEETRP